MTKPISKSKRQLAQLLIEAGVTQFPEGTNWAAQDKCDKAAVFSVNKPTHTKSRDMHFCNSSRITQVVLPELIPNWHQTALSRDEFDQIVAETVVPDRPERKGGETVFVGSGEPERVRPTKEQLGRLDSIKASITSKLIDSVDTADTLDQLLQDWRNADDYAQRKQTEADDAAAMRDERWQAVQARAGEMGVTVGRCEPVVELRPASLPEWAEWCSGDEVECVTTPGGAECKPGARGVVTRVNGDGVWARFEGFERDGRCEWFSMKGEGYRFIRRP